MAAVELTLDLDKKTVISGADVTGVLRIHCKEEFHFIAARLCISGKQISQSQNQTSRVASNDEEKKTKAQQQPGKLCTYFHTEVQTLAGLTPEEVDAGTNEGEELVLQAGTFSYPFTFPLPEDAPPSLTIDGDTVTKIGYQIKAYLATREAPAPLFEIKRPFNVFLAKQSRQMRATESAQTTKLAFDIQRCLCVSSPLYVRICLASTTVNQSSHDRLSCDVEVDNTHSSASVNGCTLTVFLHLATEGSAPIEKQVAQQVLDTKVDPGKSGTYHGRLSFPIDPKKFPPSVTTLHGPVTYHLKVELDVPMASDPYWSTVIRVIPHIDEGTDHQFGAITSASASRRSGGRVRAKGRTRKEAYKDATKTYVAPLEGDKNYAPIPIVWKRVATKLRMVAKVNMLYQSLSGNPLLASSASRHSSSDGGQSSSGGSPTIRPQHQARPATKKSGDDAQVDDFFEDPPEKEEEEQEPRRGAQKEATNGAGAAKASSEGGFPAPKDAASTSQRESADGPATARASNNLLLDHHHDDAAAPSSSSAPRPHHHHKHHHHANGAELEFTDDEASDFAPSEFDVEDERAEGA